MDTLGQSTITINTYFHGEIKTTIGTSHMPVVLSPNSTIEIFLYFLFESYPELENKFPPGTLGFTVNQVRPTEEQTLLNNDKIDFYYYPPKFSQY